MPDSQGNPSEAKFWQADKLKRQEKKAARKAAKIKSHTCDDCGESLKQRLKVVRHVSQHGHMAHRVCTTCKMVFPDRKAFKDHCKGRKHRLNMPEGSGSVLPEPKKRKPRKAGRPRHYSPGPTQAETEEKARRREEWNQLKKNRDDQLKRAPEEFHEGIHFGFSCLADDYADFFHEDLEDLDLEGIDEDMFGIRHTGYVRS